MRSRNDLTNCLYQQVHIVPSYDDIRREIICNVDHLGWELGRFAGGTALLGSYRHDLGSLEDLGRSE